MSRRQVVHIHPEAPLKPPTGAPCNGCGVCCLAEPCPLGVLMSRRLRGACRMLRWDVSQKRYVCGMVGEPGAVSDRGWSWVRSWKQRVVRRWIAAGSGCDCDLSATATDAERV